MINTINILLLAINGLLLSILISKLNKRVRNLEHTVWYLELKDMMKEGEEHEIRTNKK